MAGCRLLTVLVTASLLYAASAVNETSGVGPLVDFLPAQIDGLLLGRTATIDVKTTTQTSDCLRLSCVVAHPAVVELERGGDVTVCADLSSNDTPPHLTLRGLRLGRTSLDCQIDNDVGSLDNTTLLDKYPVVVVRERGLIDLIFFLTLNILVACINIGMGCAVDLKVVKEVLRRPVAPAIGFFSQFLIMPLVSAIFILRNEILDNQNGKHLLTYFSICEFVYFMPT